VLIPAYSDDDERFLHDLAGLFRYGRESISSPSVCLPAAGAGARARGVLVKLWKQALPMCSTVRRAEAAAQGPIGVPTAGAATAAAAAAAAAPQRRFLFRSGADDDDSDEEDEDKDKEPPAHGARLAASASASASVPSLTAADFEVLYEAEYWLSPSGALRVSFRVDAARLPCPLPRVGLQVRPIYTLTRPLSSPYLAPI
jgi:hypothetical protein